MWIFNIFGQSKKEIFSDHLVGIATRIKRIATELQINTSSKYLLSENEIYTMIDWWNDSIGHNNMYIVKNAILKSHVTMWGLLNTGNVALIAIYIARETWDRKEWLNNNLKYSNDWILNVFPDLQGKS